MASGTKLRLARGAWCAALLTSTLSSEALQIVDGDGEMVDCSWNSTAHTAFRRGGHIAGRLMLGWSCNQAPHLSQQSRRKTIACIGDSITEGSKVNRDETYPYGLYQNLKRRYNVLNLGVSGSTMQEANNLSYWTLPHWRTALESDFDLAIVQLGTNDAKKQNWNRTQYKHDYVKFLGELVKTHPKATILVSVPPPAGDNYFNIMKIVVSDKLPEAIRSVQGEFGLKFKAIDMQAAFEQDGHGLEQLLLPDNVHPSPAGYAVMAATAADAVNAALQDS